MPVLVSEIGIPLYNGSTRKLRNVKSGRFVGVLKSYPTEIHKIFFIFIVYR